MRCCNTPYTPRVTMFAIAHINKCTAPYLRQSVSLNRLSFAPKHTESRGTPAPHDLLSFSSSSPTSSSTSEYFRKLLPMPPLSSLPRDAVDASASTNVPPRRIIINASVSVARISIVECKSRPAETPRDRRASSLLPVVCRSPSRRRERHHPIKMKAVLKHIFQFHGAARVVCCSNLTRKSTPLFIIQIFAGVYYANERRSVIFVRFFCYN